MVEPSFPHRPPKTWHKIVVVVDSVMTEAVTAYLEDLSVNGIEISSSAKDPVTEKITAYIPVGSKKFEKKAVSQKIDKLKDFLGGLSTIFKNSSAARLKTEILVEEDWGKTWKSFFTSFQITPRITIKPSWEEIKSSSSKEHTTNSIIEMDPGLAFGTGHHASTQLALLLLEELFEDNQKSLKNIIDVGTGSGILAMGCALFGANKVLAIDNDQDAVETAKRNIIRNNLEHIIHVSGQDIASIDFVCDLLVANITHDTLVAIAKVLTARLVPGAYLVLSGILKGDQENSIKNIYTGQELDYIKSLTKDEWSALLFQKV